MEIYLRNRVMSCIRHVTDANAHKRMKHAYQKWAGFDADASFSLYYDITSEIYISIGVFLHNKHAYTNYALYA